jgi:hypothetical protein
LASLLPALHSAYIGAAGETQSAQKAAAAMRIEEVQSASKKQRIATHTHIKALGLDVAALTSPARKGGEGFF